MAGDLLQFFVDDGKIVLDRKLVAPRATAQVVDTDRA